MDDKQTNPEALKPSGIRLPREYLLTYLAIIYSLLFLFDPILFKLGLGYAFSSKTPVLWFISLIGAGALEVSMEPLFGLENMLRQYLPYIISGLDRTQSALLTAILFTGVILLINYWILKLFKR